MDRAEMIEPPGGCVMRLIIEASEDSLIQAVNVAKAAVKRGRGRPCPVCNGGGE